MASWAAPILPLLAGERISPQTVPSHHTPIETILPAKLNLSRACLFQKNIKNLLKKANTSYFSWNFNEKTP